MSTATWNETDHPREAQSKRFTEKQNSSFEGELPTIADDAPLKPTYTMPAAYVPYAKDKVSAANARLQKLGIEERFTVDIEYENIQKDGRYEQLAHMSLNTPAISYGGWAFAGVHEFTADGRVLHHLTSDPAARAVDDDHCDHCGHNRRRGKVFTVTNEAGETKQVGSNCLEAFLGIKPQGLWALQFDDLEELEEYAEENPLVHGSSEVYPAEDVVVAALVATRDGQHYVSRMDSNIGNPATAQVVVNDWDALMKDGDTDARRKLARKVLRWVNSVDAGDNEYLGNLREVLAGKERFVGSKHIGIAASVVTAYRNDLERKEREAAKAKRIAERVKGYIAPEGEKVADIPATIVRTRDFETMYGTTTLITMRADTGHTITWFASGYKEYEEGAKISVSGRVKKHDVYDGDDQTVLTRAKIARRE